jgi:8-oxo-dGTP pyrophosphatase MutT (NUDIX family)
VNFDAVLEILDEALQRPLPGQDAQDLLTPVPRREWPQNWNPARIRNAAGLLLLFPVGDRTHVVLTVRSDAVRHGGQVSMPGGVVEPGETFEQAALREAHEEVGLPLEAVQVLGALTPIDIPVSGFRLHPIVAAARERPALRPADAEVARILEIDLDALYDPRAIAWRVMTRDSATRNVPAIVAGGAEIWGATAMVLAEFLTLLGWQGPKGEVGEVRSW